MSGNSPLAAARAYLAHGWAPLPVQYRRKAPHPGVSDGWQRLRLGASDLETHFGGEPINVGVILGGASGGLIDVDLDCAESILLADTFLPPTGAVFGRATKPRSHRLYRVEGNSRTEQYRSADGSMIVELRGDGAQTVFPGSVHESGEPVRWVSAGTPLVIDRLSLAQSVRRLAAASLLAQNWPHAGGRQDAALALGGWLARCGWPLAEVEMFVRAVALAARDEESEKRVASVRATFEKLERGEEVTGGARLGVLLGELVVKRVAVWLEIDRQRQNAPGAGQRRTKPVVRIAEFVPFPVELLPEPIRSFVKEFSESLGCDPAYLAVPVFGVLGAAIGNTRTIRLKVGWAEPAVIWALVVSPSGTLKSPALDAVLAPVREFQILGLREHRDAVAEHKRRMEAYKRDLHEYKQRKQDAPPEKPKKPVLLRFFCEDATVEALAVLLSETLRGTLMFRDELSGWLRSFNQYKGGRGGDEAHWLAMHGARTLTVDRKTGEPRYIHVPRAAVCIVGGIQPEVLATSLSNDHMHSGLAARVLFAYPPRRKKKWSEAEASEWTKDDYKRVLDKLYKLAPATAAGDVCVPVEIPLSPDAKDLWVAFYDEHADEQIGMTGAAAAAWSKLEGYAARLALVIHCVRQAYSDPEIGETIDAQSMAAGIALSRWFGNEALRVYAMLQGESADRALHERLEVVRTIGGQVTARGWQRRRKLLTSAEAQKELDEFVDAGLGTWSSERPGEGGGRPQRWFIAISGDKTPLGGGDEGVSSPSPSEGTSSEASPEGGASSMRREGDDELTAQPPQSPAVSPTTDAPHLDEGDRDKTPRTPTQRGVSSPDLGAEGLP